MNKIKLTLFSLIFILFSGFGTLAQVEKTDSIPTHRTYVFVDSFNDNSKKWFEGKQKGFYCRIKNGKYIIDYNAAESSYNLYNSVYLDPEKDYIIESNIFKVEGDLDYGYGLTFGYKDPNNKFDFLIANNGNYKIIQWLKGVNTDLVGWSVSTGIKKGNGVNNKLSIKKGGKDLQFFINDIYVNHISFPVFYGDRIGFVVNKIQHLEVDDLQIYYVGTATN